MANILLPTQQLRLQEGYAKGADNVAMTNASIASRFATIQPVKSNTHIPFLVNPTDQLKFAGKALGIVEQFQETQRAREKEVVYTDAINDYTQRVNDITNAFKDEHGKNAIDNYDKYKAKIDNLNKEYSEVFKKHADLQQQFTVATSKLNSRATLELDNWKSNETIKAKADTLNLNVTNKGNTYLYNIGSPAEKKYREDYFNSFLEYAKYMGWSGDIATAEWTKRFTEDAYSYADYACDIKNFGGALSFIQRNKNDLDPSAYYKILARIRRAQEADRASRAGKSSSGLLTPEEIMLVEQRTVNNKLATVAKEQGMTVAELQKSNPNLYNSTVRVAKIEANKYVGDYTRNYMAHYNANNLSIGNIQSSLSYIIENNPNLTMADLYETKDYYGWTLKATDLIKDENERKVTKDLLANFAFDNGEKTNELIRDKVLAPMFNWNEGYGLTLANESTENLANRFESEKDLLEDLSLNHVSPQYYNNILQKYRKGSNDKANGKSSEYGDLFSVAENALWIKATGATTAKNIKDKMKDPKFSWYTPIFKKEISTKILKDLPRDSEGNINYNLAVSVVKERANDFSTQFLEDVGDLPNVVDDVVDDLDLNNDSEKSVARKMVYNDVNAYMNKYNMIPSKETLTKIVNARKDNYYQMGYDDPTQAMLKTNAFNLTQDNSGEVSRNTEVKFEFKKIKFRLEQIEKTILRDKGDTLKQLNVPQLRVINSELKDLFYKSPKEYNKQVEELKEQVKNSKINQSYKDILLEGL